MRALFIIECGAQKVRLDLCEIADDFQLVWRWVNDVDPRAFLERLERELLQRAALHRFVDFQHERHFLLLPSFVLDFASIPYSGGRPCPSPSFRCVKKYDSQKFRCYFIPLGRVCLSQNKGVVAVPRPIPHESIAGFRDPLQQSIKKNLWSAGISTGGRNMYSVNVHSGMNQ